MKAAQREEAAQAKAAAAVQAAQEKLARATQRSHQAAQRRATLAAAAAEKTGGRQARVSEGGQSSTAWEFAFAYPQPGTQHSQFAPYTTPFQQSSPPPEAQRPFLYGPPSPLSPFPQIDIPLASTLHSPQCP